MSYRDADVYGDVVDVLDNIRDTVESYLTGMQEEDAQAARENNKEAGGDSQEYSLASPSAITNSSCRLYIKENGPLVIQLSELVQSVLREVIERQQRGLHEATTPAQANASAAPTAEEARSEAVRALVTRKLGELMENTHTMRSVVKQQQQQRRWQRFGEPMRSSSDSNNDLRMKQLLRVISHDLEDTERLLHIAFPETFSSAATVARTSTSPLLSPAQETRGSGLGPERFSDGDGGNPMSADSASETPRTSTNTVPYVRRSVSPDASGLPQQSSSNSGREPTVEEGKRASALAKGGEDSALHSLEAAQSSSVSSNSHTAKQAAPRVRFALDCNDDDEANNAEETAADLNDDNNSNTDYGGALKDLHELSERARASGLTSNPVHLRLNVGNGNIDNGSSNSSCTSNNRDNPNSASNTTASNMGRSFSNVLGGAMQLAPFSRRRPSLTTDKLAASATTTTNAGVEPGAAERKREKEEAKRARQEKDDRLGGAVGEVDQDYSAATSTSLGSLQEATETRPYNDPLHIIAASEVPRGILKTSSSRLGSTSAIMEGNANDSRSSAASSLGTSRPAVQFADDVLAPRPDPVKSAGNNSTNSNYNNSNGSSCGPNATASSTSYQNNNNGSSSSRPGSGRARGPPGGLPPRSPRAPAVTPIPLSFASRQRPPLAPTSSTSLTAVPSYPAPSRNVWVTTTHVQRLPGEFWGEILVPHRRAMVDILRKDVIDLFNYGKEDAILHPDDVTDVRFTFEDNYLIIHFELEHQRSLTESEINLRLDLCVFPWMTGLYEDYFQKHHAHEFDLVEDSLSSFRSLAPPQKGSARHSVSDSTPSCHEDRSGGSGEESDSKRMAKPVSFSFSLATPQPLGPSAQGEQVPIVSLLSLTADTTESHAADSHTDSRTASVVGESAVSFSFASHRSAVGTTPPPGSVSPSVVTGVVNPADSADTNTTSPSTLVAAAPSVNEAAVKVPSPLPTPPREGGGNDRGHSSSSSGGGGVASSLSSTKSSTCFHAHTVRLPGQHWEAVTTQVPEADLADAFVADVGTALGLLPSQARASCQRIRFYLGGLVVKFWWSSAESSPAVAPPPTAADVDAKLTDYGFPWLRQVYAASCKALHLTDDIASAEKETKRSVNSSSSSHVSEQQKREEGVVLTHVPVAQFTLPKKAQLDRAFADEATPLESSTLTDNVAMQHRGEGAPSRSPSLSLTCLPHSSGGNSQDRKGTPTRVRKNVGLVYESTPAPASAAAAAAAATTTTTSSAAGRVKSHTEVSPDPVAAAVSLSHMEHHDSNAEAEPRATMPRPTKFVSPTRSHSSHRYSNFPRLVPPPPQRSPSRYHTDSSVATSEGARGVTAGTVTAPRVGRRSRSGDGTHRVATPPRLRRETAAEAPPAKTTTTTTAAAATVFATDKAPAKAESLPPTETTQPSAASPPPPPLPPPSTAAGPTAPDAAGASAPSSVAPRSVSARRHEEGAVVSLRHRPRLTPKDHNTEESATSSPPAPAPSTSARHTDPAAAAADKLRQRPQRSTSATSSRLAPPSSVTDAEARRTPHTTTTTTTASGHAAVTTSVKSVPHAQTSGPQLQSGLETSPLLEKQRSRSFKQRHTSAPRLREASPRSVHAAAITAASTAPPDHTVYQLPPEVLGRDSMLIPSDKTQDLSDSLPVARSARRRHQPSQQEVITSQVASRGVGSSTNSNNCGGSEAGDSESGGALLIEHELGVRLNGLTVEGVRKKGVAAEAGLQVGDTLRTMDGQILASERDLYRGLLQQMEQVPTTSSGEHTLFVTAVNARGNPVTYRFRLPPATAAAGGAGIGGTAAGLRRSTITTRKVPGASMATATSSGSENLSAARHATMALLARVPQPRSSSPRTTATTRTRGLRGGEATAAEATPVARTRVSSVSAATREPRAQRSHSTVILRQTEAPTTVHSSIAAGSPARLSARRAGRDSSSAPRARPNTTIQN